MIDFDTFTEERFDSLVGYAYKVSGSGECQRRQIGCVGVLSGGQPISVGYNGPPGSLNFVRGQCDCPGRNVMAGQGAYQHVECYAVHAEMRMHRTIPDPMRGRLSVVISTKAPCTNCTLFFLDLPTVPIITYHTMSNDTTAYGLCKSAGALYLSFTEFRDLLRNKGKGYTHMGGEVG